MNTSANTKRSLTIGISDPPKKEARISGLSFIVSDGHAFTGSRTPSDFVGLRFAHGNYHGICQLRNTVRSFRRMYSYAQEILLQKFSYGILYIPLLL